jgi:pyridoxine 4-dehydrogenase
MPNQAPVKTYLLAGRPVRRIGYGAMQLAGPRAFGPPKDRDAALAVLRAAVEAGIDHIDTADVYGPHLTNLLIRDALHPYPRNLTIVTKIGVRRDDAGAWLPAPTPQELRQQVRDNLRNLGVDVLDIVNMRVMHDVYAPSEGSIEPQVTALAELQRAGLVRHIGLSNVTLAQLAEAQRIADIVCVQNHYNLVHRNDDALVDDLASEGIAFVPFFPLGGFTPIQSSVLAKVAESIDATPRQVALAWLLHRSPNILLIPGTSSVGHLHENIAAHGIELTRDALSELDAIGRPREKE